jgi:hypothetical protein
MSIVALKRKSAAIKNQSTGRSQFSINGTTRNQGYIGQTLQSRHLIHTPHRGSVAKDYSGCCNDFDIPPSELTHLEDSTVVKTSVLSYKGMMARRMLGTTFNVVKPDNSHNGSDQGSYIDRLKRKNLKQIEDYCPEPLDPQPIRDDACRLLRTLKGARIFSKPKTVCNIAKKVGPDTQEEHVAKLDKACLANDVSFIVNTNVQRTPYV